MWRLLVKEIVFAAIQGVAAFFYAKWKNAQTRKAKAKQDKRILKAEKKVFKDEKEKLDLLDDIDSNL